MSSFVTETSKMHIEEKMTSSASNVARMICFTCFVLSLQILVGFLMYNEIKSGVQEELINQIKILKEAESSYKFKIDGNDELHSLVKRSASNDRYVNFLMDSEHLCSNLQRCSGLKGGKNSYVHISVNRPKGDKGEKGLPGIQEPSDRVKGGYSVTMHQSLHPGPGLKHIL